MKNDTSSIISRFHVSSMSMALLLILGMGAGALYSILTGFQSSLDSSFIGHWAISIQVVLVLWMLFNFKDWMAYYKLHKQNNKIIHDERFVQHGNRAAKVSFGFMIFSNLALLLTDLIAYPLPTAFVTVFSLVFGVSVYLLTYIILELKE